MLKFLCRFVFTMKLPATILNPILRRKLVTALLIGASSVAAFATLGDGSTKAPPLKDKNLLALPTVPVNYKTFSLKSGYSFRGNTFLNNDPTEKVVMLNTVMTYQKGNATYIVPLKKKLLLGKVALQPTAPQR